MYGVSKIKKNLENVSRFSQILSSTTVFNISYNKKRF